MLGGDVFDQSGVFDVFEDFGDFVDEGFDFFDCIRINHRRLS